MEIMVQNIPAAVSAILAAVLALMIVTNIIVGVLKGLTYGKMPTNILAFLVAISVTLAAFFAGCQIAGVAIAWHMVAGAIVLGIFVAYAAMYGFDKFRQTIEQLKAVNGK